MLEVKGLHAYYGKSHVLHGVDLSVGAGEIVSLLGRNGVGRSTTVMAIMGLVRAEGDVIFKQQQIVGAEPHKIAQLGLGYVAENREIFPDLTVEQNMLLGMKSSKHSGRWKLGDMYDLFPNLRERADTSAGVLSGGEQQMLAMCRTLMGDPDLIMIDEPTEGLAPKIVEQVGSLLVEIASRDVSVLLIEQKLSIALKISQRVYVMGHGEIVYEGSPQELLNNEQVRKEWLEV